MKYQSIIVCLALFPSVVTSCKKDSSGNDPVPPALKVTVSTFAGEGTEAYRDGALLFAQFRTPIDIAISASGILYIADYNGRRIRKIANGQVSVLAGDGNFGTRNGAGDTAQFVDPYRIEVDTDGNVYVMDQADARVRLITPN